MECLADIYFLAFFINNHFFNIIWIYPESSRAKTLELFEILYKYHEAFLKGLLVTLKLSMIIWIIGIVMGVLLGVLADRHKQGIGIPLFCFSFLLSGVPVLVLLFWAHFPLQVILNVVIDPFVTAACVLSLVNTFMVTDVVKNILATFPEQYITAARVCGMDNRTIVMKIKLPIILQQLIPVLLTTQMIMLQTTLFASLISVEEILRVCQRVNASAYKPVEIYTALAFLFLLICLPMNGLALWLKKKYTRDFSER